VRAYTSDPVPDEDLRRILDAARLAPSSGNQQPWRFLVVRDRAKLDELLTGAMALKLDAARDQLYEMASEEVEAQTAQLRAYLEGFLSAPVYVVILLDRESTYPDYNVQDGALAAGHMMLAARALGYGTVYGSDAIPESAIRMVLEIPDRYQFLCFMAIGVPSAWPEAPEKKPLDDLVVYESFG
jgi:nitroreductase